MTNFGSVRQTNPNDNHLDEPWSSLRGQWSDMAAHRRFVLMASAADMLDDAAKRYKRCEADPTLAMESRRALELVFAEAMARLNATAVERAHHGLIVVPMLVLLTALCLTLAASHALGRTSLKTPAVLLCEVALVALVPWRRVLEKR